MNPPPVNIRTLVERLPYPVARPAAVAFGFVSNQSPQARLWDVPFTAYQTLRMATLPVVAAYLQSPIPTADMPSQKAVGAIATALASLRNPHFSDWVSLLHTLAKRVHPETVGIAPSLPLETAVTALASARVAPFSPSYGSANAEPHRALNALRNGLAHGGGMPDATTCAALLEHYLPILETFLRAFRFLAGCQLRIRSGPFDDESTEVYRLVGWELPPPATLGESKEAEAWGEALEEGPVAARLPGGVMVPLWPLFGLGGESPVGIYDGHYLLETVGSGNHAIRERFVYYLGAGHGRWTDSAAVERLVELLEARRVRWRLDKKSLAPWTVADSTRFTSASTIADLEGRKYFPACYVERKALTYHWGRFLNSSDSMASARQRHGLVLVGAAGSGKTAWSAHTAAQLMAEGITAEAGDVGERDGRNLVLFLRGDMVAERASREDRLLAAVIERLGLRDKDFSCFGDLLQALDREWRNDRVPNRRFIVLLDAVNEAPRAENLMREALELVAAAASFAWCRVVITIRREFLDTLRRRVEPGEKDIFFAFAPCLYTSDDREPVVELPVLSDEEAETAYERAREHGLADQPGCVTPWRNLDSTTHELLRAPLLLNIFHRSWSGRPAAQVSDRGELFRAYVEVLMSEDRALEEAARAVVRHILETSRADLSEEDAHNLRRSWANQFTVAELRFKLSPIEALLNSGLLRRRIQGYGTGYVFVYETVLEYLIYLFWEREDPELSLPTLQRLTMEGRDRSTLASYWGGFQFVFDRLLQEGRYNDWVWLAVGSPVSLYAVARARWTAAARALVSRGSISEEEALRSGPGRIAVHYGTSLAEAAIHLSAGLQNETGVGGRREWDLILWTSAWQLFDWVVKDEGRFWDLACYDARDAFELYEDGKTRAAVAHFSYVRGKCIKRIRAEGRQDLALELAVLDTSLATTLERNEESDYWRDGRIAEAYQRARDTYTWLVEDKGRSELTRKLAWVESQLGSALARHFDQNGAEAAFRRAGEIYTRLVESEERWELAHDLMTVEYNLGDNLANKGRLAESIAHYQRARKLCARLVETEGRWDLAGYLARIDIDLGIAFQIEGDLEEAVAAYQRARAVRARLMESDQSWELANDLADADCSLGFVLADQGNLADAVVSLERARTVWTRLVEVEGRWELADALFRANNNLGFALLGQGDFAGALAAYQRARAIRVRMMETGGGRELDNERALALIDHNLGLVLSCQGDFEGAVSAYQRSRDIYSCCYLTMNIQIG